MAIRIIRGYRTISYDAALTLAGTIPYDMVANADAETYYLARHLRMSGHETSKALIKQLRDLALKRASHSRKAELEASSSAHKRGVKKLLPLWDSWLAKGTLTLSYRITQVLSGHGCFGEYLHRIGAEEHPGCHEYGAALNYPQHTLESCPSFEQQRLTLQHCVGPLILSEALVKTLIGNDLERSAVSLFCDEVLKIKKTKEMEREKATLSRKARREIRTRTRRQQRLNNTT